MSERVAEFRRELAREPIDFMLRQVPDLLQYARARLAEYLGSEPRRVLLTSNVTGAVNLVASSLHFRGPGDVLMTDREYATMRWCWERAARREGFVVKTFPVPAMPSGPHEIVDAATAAMTSSTRLFFFSHVLASTGLVLPVQALCEEARKRGITTVIDGAHGPALTDLDIARLRCDFYAGSGHKWLLAPTGTGFLHIGEGLEDVLEPLQVSWGYPPSASAPELDLPDRYGSTPRLRRLECMGTRDISPWLTLPDAIDFLGALGHDAVRSRMRSLSDYAREVLADSLGLRCVTPETRSMSSGMTTFVLPLADGARIGQELWDLHRIEVAIFEERGDALLRVSTHVFNDEDDLDHLAQALCDVVPRGGRLHAINDHPATHRSGLHDERPRREP
ncbi:MAG: aminotransferase class V-fold PLP-dependent enzyme [Micrococcales bacterium]|nr:aminotransferase class V-fold PLP-dependent enzyme [Micrococcales bacterium]